MFWNKKISKIDRLEAYDRILSCMDNIEMQMKMINMTTAMLYETQRIASLEISKNEKQKLLEGLFKKQRNMISGHRQDISDLQIAIRAKLKSFVA